MEMEDDMEVGLVQQFSCLGTTDKEVLVAQLQKLVGPQLNTSAAHFFLDMNNWNLQLAVGAYFDLTEDSPPSTQHNSNSLLSQANGTVSQQIWKDDESWEPVDQQPQQQHQQPAPTSDRASCIVSNCGPKTNAYSMSIIQDHSVTEDTIIPPNTKFVKVWKIQNNGNLPWPPGSHLRVISGYRSMVAQEKIYFNPLVQPDECREISVECLSPNIPGNYQICWQMSTPEGFLFGDEIWVICSVGMDVTVDLTERLQSLSCDNPCVNVNFPLNPLAPSRCPSTVNAQVPTSSAAVVGAGGGDSIFVCSSQDTNTEMS